MVFIQTGRSPNAITFRRFYTTISFLALLPPALASAQQAPSVAPAIPIVPRSVSAVASKSSPQIPAQAHQLTREDAEAWLDGCIPSALQRGDVAGAVVVIVKDGQVLLAKGYGNADVAAQKPVDSKTTLFRPGSISKLFTWTAVMQLVEQGKLDLDADVNGYLDFKIPPWQGQPITLRNLMTHTSGFDEVGGLLLFYDPRELLSLEEELKRHLPPRVTAPGILPAYSNYGAALAGYIVQRLSGEPFEEYIERHIFAPLGINHATFRQPLPATLAPMMSKGYPVASGDPKPFELDSSPPDGALSASGGDMGRFMIAHLQNGAFGSERILQKTTAMMMHRTPLTIIPQVNRMLLGFYESNINRHRVIAHGGDLNWFHSDLNLFVDDGVGVFISLNSLGKDGAAEPIRTGFFRQFSDRYFPDQAPEGSVETKAGHASRVSGRYAFSRRSHKSFLSVVDLIAQVKVVPTNDGSISVADFKGLNGEPKEWREIAPFVWCETQGTDRIAAKVDGDRVELLGYDELPFMPLQPVPWWWSAAWLLPLLILAIAALVANTLAWPVAALMRRHYGIAYQLAPDARKAQRMIRIASLSIVAVVIGWFVLLQIILGDSGWTGPHLPIWISLLRLLSLLVFLGGSAVALWNVFVLLRSQRTALAKLWGLVIASSSLALLYAALIFHLVGYSGKY